MPRNQESLNNLKNERRNAIIKSALYLFSECGYAAVTLDDISKESGLKRPLIYHYFNSKEDIFHAVMKYTFDTFKERISFISPSELDSYSRLEHLVQDMRNILMDQNDELPCMLFLLLNIHLQKEFIPKPKERKQKKETPLLFKLISEAKNDGGLGNIDELGCSLALLAMFKGLAFNRINLGSKKFICPSLKIIMNVFKE